MADDPALEPLEAEGQPPEDERPDWLLDKFKTPEDQARAYAESERAMRQMQEHQARQDEFIQQMALRMEEPDDSGQQYAPQGGVDPLTAQMEMALAEGDAQTALAIQAWVAQQVAQQTISQAQQQQMNSGEMEASGAMFVKMVEDTARQNFADDDGWKAIEEEVGALINDRPHLIRQTTNPLEAAEDLLYIARMVQSQKGAGPPADNSHARELEGALGSVGIQGDRGKRLAQSLSGAGVRTAGAPDDDAAYFERVKAARGNEWRG